MIAKELSEHFANDTSHHVTIVIERTHVGQAVPATNIGTHPRGHLAQALTDGGLLSMRKLVQNSQQVGQALDQNQLFRRNLAGNLRG
jgi:hypothetical protein